MTAKQSVAGETATDDSIVDETPPLTVIKEVLWDGVFGGIAGTVGNVVMLGTLFLAAQVGGFELSSFGFTARLLALDLLLTETQLVWVGFVLFVGAGMTVWPLLLATLGSYLPGEGYAAKGLGFGAIMWTGFSFGFYSGQTGLALVVYLVASLLGHLGYGFATGYAMDRLFAEEGRPVVAESISSPATGTEPSANPNVESNGVGSTTRGEAQASEQAVSEEEAGEEAEEEADDK
jgi:hypothetical protein